MLQNIITKGKWGGKNGKKVEGGHQQQQQVVMHSERQRSQEQGTILNSLEKKR